MQKKSFILLFAFLSCYAVFAQTAEQFNQDSKNALELFGEQKYKEAIPYFEGSFRYAEKLNLQSYYVAQYRRRAADCYESVGLIANAEKQYKLAFQDIEADKEQGKKSLAYAEMLRRFGNFCTRQKNTT